MLQMQEIGDEKTAPEYRIVWLSHGARARLARAGVLPRSLPELPSQLREHGKAALASSLSIALAARFVPTR